MDKEIKKTKFLCNLLFLKKIKKFYIPMKCLVIIKFVDEEMYNVFIHNAILLLHLNL